jgi:hypothetical protein
MELYTNILNDRPRTVCASFPEAIAQILRSSLTFALREGHPALLSLRFVVAEGAGFLCRHRLDLAPRDLCV